MLKKKTTAFLCFLLCAQFIMGQERIIRPNIGLKWAPAGIGVGSLSLHAEYNFGKNSLTANIGVPVAMHHNLSYDGKNADFNMKATSFLAGYRTYLSKKHMKGLYFEPFFKYLHHTSEGVGLAVLAGETVKMNFTNDYNGVGFGVQLGAQFLIRNKFIIDFFFLGPEVNAARNNFTAMELSNTLPWTSSQASEAESDIRTFIDKFPFIRNKVAVSLDQVNKTVRADFKGTIPGYRVGVSFGVAF
ncbi:MAG: hypothetical protein ACJ749_06965 [Flavisolibacter sp.]